MEFGQEEGPDAVDAEVGFEALGRFVGEGGAGDAGVVEEDV